MERLIPLVLVLSFAFQGARAETRKQDPVKTKSFGEGGGYTHPDSSVGGYLETVSPAPRLAPAQQAPAAVASGENDESMDSINEGARHDYELRLFGDTQQRRRPALGEPVIRLGTEDHATLFSSPQGNLFVSLDIDPGPAGSLRDAVAGLSAAASFHPDDRFQPVLAGGNAVRLTGWLPSSRLGDVFALAGVRRVTVEGGSRRAVSSEVAGDFVLAIRVPDPASAGESVAAVAGDLERDYGFVVADERRSGAGLKIETASDGSRFARVVGRLRLDSLSRVMGHPDVLRIDAALDEFEAKNTGLEGVPFSRRAMGFARFVMERGLWLVLITLLLILPSVTEAVKKGLYIFVPCRTKVDMSCLAKVEMSGS
ncbi:MAG: hypothetical protein AAB036_08655, partial [Elusimicrobiota bacterium]